MWPSEIPLGVEKTLGGHSGKKVAELGGAMGCGWVLVRGWGLLPPGVASLVVQI